MSDNKYWSFVNFIFMSISVISLISFLLGFFFDFSIKIIVGCFFCMLIFNEAANQIDREHL